MVKYSLILPRGHRSGGDNTSGYSSVVWLELKPHACKVYGIDAPSPNRCERAGELRTNPITRLTPEILT